MVIMLTLDSDLHNITFQMSACQYLVSLDLQNTPEIITSQAC